MPCTLYARSHQAKVDVWRDVQCGCNCCVGLSDTLADAEEDPKLAQLDVEQGVVATEDAPKAFSVAGSGYAEPRIEDKPEVVVLGLKGVQTV